MLDSSVSGRLTALPETTPEGPAGTSLTPEWSAGPPSWNQARISVLFLVDQLTELGGGERILLKIAQSLPPDRFQVTIVAFRSDPDPLIHTLPCEILIFPMKRTYGKDGLRVARMLRKLVRERQVDLVHTFFETSDLFGAVIAKLSGVRAIVSSRRDMGILRSAKHNIAYRTVSLLYDRVLTVSDQVRAETIRRDRLNPSKVVTIHNGISLKSFVGSATTNRPFRAAHGIPKSAKIVATIANVQPWKGLDVFVRCAAEVHRTAPDVHFVVAGAFSDALLTAKLFDLTRELGLDDRMHWIGQTHEVYELLSETDVFCLLSESEGFPNVVIEAMAAGVPVVATRVGGTPEAVEHGSTGWLVEAGDHLAAAERVTTTLSDGTLRRSLSDAALACVKTKFTSEQMMASYIDVYESVLHGKTGGAKGRS